MKINYWWRKIERWATENNYEITALGQWEGYGPALIFKDYNQGPEQGTYLVGLPVIMNRGNIELANATRHFDRESAEYELSQGVKR